MARAARKNAPTADASAGGATGTAAPAADGASSGAASIPDRNEIASYHLFDERRLGLVRSRHVRLRLQRRVVGGQLLVALADGADARLRERVDDDFTHGVGLLTVGDWFVGALFAHLLSHS